MFGLTVHAFDIPNIAHADASTNERERRHRRDVSSPVANVSQCGSIECGCCRVFVSGCPAGGLSPEGVEGLGGRRLVVAGRGRSMAWRLRCRRAGALAAVGLPPWGTGRVAVLSGWRGWRCGRGAARGCGWCCPAAVPMVEPGAALLAWCCCRCAGVMVTGGRGGPGGAARCGGVAIGRSSSAVVRVGWFGGGGAADLAPEGRAGKVWRGAETRSQRVLFSPGAGPRMPGRPSCSMKVMPRSLK